MSPTRFRCANSLTVMRPHGSHTPEVEQIWAKNASGGHEGIEPSTSPTLKENHTTRPMALECDATRRQIRPAILAEQKKNKDCICLEWDSNPRIRRYLNLSQAPWTARPSKHEVGLQRPEPPENTQRPKKKKSAWSIRVSIPVPRACKARTLPIELMPHHLVHRSARLPKAPLSCDPTHHKK